MKKPNKPRRPEGPPKPQKPKPPPRSWIWVGTDTPETRIFPHEVTLGVEIDPAQGATIDLFVERGGKTFTGLTMQAIRVPGLKSFERLAGAEIIDPPPAVVGIGRMGSALPTCGGTGPGAATSLLKKLAPEGPAPAPAPEPPPEPEMDEDEPEGDDDETLGDIESYRKRRAEEGKLEVHDDPELDEEAIEEAEAAAAAERVLIAPGQAYEVERIRLKILGVRGKEVELDVEGLGRRVEEEGELGGEPVRFGGHLVARLELA